MWYKLVVLGLCGIRFFMVLRLYGIRLREEKTEHFCSNLCWIELGNESVKIIFFSADNRIERKEIED